MPYPFTGIPLRQWRLLSLARHRLLLLDYDGTLAPLQAARDRAIPSPRSLTLLKQIVAEGLARVVIVSGRPVDQLRRLLGPLPMGLIGEHGWERRLDDGPVERFPLPAGVESRLERAAAELRAHRPAARLERKRSSLALHTRGLAAGDAEADTRAARSLWEPLARDGPLELRRFDGGLELRARGRDKGSAVRALLELEPAGAFATYVGDDETDEDAFEVLLDIGFGVRVGEPGAPTLATGWLAGPSDVEAFLEEYLRVARAA